MCVRETVWVCVCVYVFEVCREVWVTAGGGSVWADCQLWLFNPPSLFLSLTFSFIFPPCLVSFSLVFTHTYTDMHNAPVSFSLSDRTGQTAHTSPQQKTVKEVWKRERGQRRKGAPVSKCSTSSGDSTWGSSHSVCLFYAPFTRGSMYTDTQEPSCSAGVFLMQINVSC